MSSRGGEGVSQIAILGNPSRRARLGFSPVSRRTRLTCALRLPRPPSGDLGAAPLSTPRTRARSAHGKTKADVGWQDKPPTIGIRTVLDQVKGLRAQ